MAGTILLQKRMNDLSLPLALIEVLHQLENNLIQIFSLLHDPEEVGIC